MSIAIVGSNLSHLTSVISVKMLRYWKNGRRFTEISEKKTQIDGQAVRETGSQQAMYY
jgi:hypothetical protein